MTRIAAIMAMGKTEAAGLNDGDPVSTWEDSSGNGHTATMTGSNRPTYKSAIVNGMPVVRFTTSGASKLDLGSTIPGGTSYTILTVMKATGSGVSCWTLTAAASDIIPFGPVELSGSIYTSSRSDYIVSSTDLSGAFHVITGGFNTPNAFGLVSDGTVLSSAPPAAFGPTTANWGLIGYRADSLYSDGDIAEIIMYNTAISSTDRENVEKYLGTKYGITVAGGSAVQPDTVTGLVAWWKADTL